MLGIYGSSPRRNSCFNSSTVIKCIRRSLLSQVAVAQPDRTAASRTIRCHQAQTALPCIFKNGPCLSLTACWVNVLNPSVFNRANSAVMVLQKDRSEKVSLAKEFLKRRYQHCWERFLSPVATAMFACLLESSQIRRVQRGLLRAADDLLPLLSH